MKTILLVSIIFLMGCTTAGPYVTNISSDGKCTLYIEKSSTEFSMLTSTVSNKPGNQITLKICD